MVTVCAFYVSYAVDTVPIFDETQRFDITEDVN
jgi:hypothetical protein